MARLTIFRTCLAEVEFVFAYLKHVTRLACAQSRLGQRLPKLRDLDLHHLLGGVRHVLAPERIDELFARDRAICVQEQNRKERPLLPCRDPQRPVVTENL